MMNQQKIAIDRFGHLISDWEKSPPPSKKRCEVSGTLSPQRTKNTKSTIEEYQFVILVQSEDPTEDDDVSRVALSPTLQVELRPVAPDGEYGIFKIVGNGATLNLLCHCRTISFAYFAKSCIDSGKLVLEVREGDGPFVPHVIELNAENVSLTRSLADVAEFLKESSADTLTDCFGALRNFDFFCDIVPALAHPGGGRVLNMLDAVKTLGDDWLDSNATTMQQSI